MSPFQPPTWALPTLTALIGSGGFIVGIYSFLSPVQAARVYGVDLPMLSQTVHETKHSTKESVLADQSQPNNILHHVAYIYAHGIRNFSTGLSILGLTAFWQFSPYCRTSAVASSTVQKSLGIVILAGALTPVADALVTGHVAGNGSEANGVGRKAARVHASRESTLCLDGVNGVTLEVDECSPNSL
ncbi:uncharacterized protein A1O9_07307 [Exophiala aquamarina CBS 119918]|uniref:Uncharacterized protein n=1 Tax=Exophiala aquamarina CBS 119918 TaxID=1182545 RepID=A0A072PBH3_9EURO|nr:uncharacterized protein A1O9_07307 [Exophiala aquamarina CBS 119918]KEF57117.1 hypothetical protein A1O9_07307 [Exophiala aquamarina CBS 119918]